MRAPLSYEYISVDIVDENKANYNKKSMSSKAVYGVFHDIKATEVRQDRHLKRAVLAGAFASILLRKMRFLTATALDYWSDEAIFTPWT